MSNILDQLKRAEEERQRIVEERKRLEAEADAALDAREREEHGLQPRDAPAGPAAKPPPTAVPDAEAKQLELARERRLAEDMLRREAEARAAAELAALKRAEELAAAEAAARGAAEARAAADAEAARLAEARREAEARAEREGKGRRHAEERAQAQAAARSKAEQSPSVPAPSRGRWLRAGVLLAVIVALALILPAEKEKPEAPRTAQKPEASAIGKISEAPKADPVGLKLDRDSDGFAERVRAKGQE